MRERLSFAQNLANFLRLDMNSLRARKSNITLLLSLLLLASCGGGGSSGILGGVSANFTANSSPVFAILSTVPAGSCPSNGITVDTGVDTNRNGTLDPAEITGTQYVCSWTSVGNGFSSIATFTTEIAGANCAAGGKQVNVGLDVNANNLLDSVEITSSSYICNGTAGTAGSAWRDGNVAPANSLGIDGDYYLNTATGDIYLRLSGAYSIVANIMGATGTNGAIGPTGATGAAGTNGTNGAVGAAGSVWHTGSGVPSNSVGIEGDYYLNAATGDVYLKALGSYSLIANIMGATGTTGATGVNGTTGATGATGVAGTNGSVWHNGSGIPANSLGVEGDYYLNTVTGDVYLKALGSYSLIANIMGATGATGPTGATGAAGTNGATGATGAAGSNGTNGVDGAAGATGATGATGAGLSEYAYIYNLAAQTVAVEAPALLDSNGVMSTGITHTAGTSGITVINAGIYEIAFSLSGTEPNQFALFVDGVVVPSSVYGSGAGTQQTNGQVILALGANSVITLVNHSSAAAVGLASVIGGTAANVNASILIRKLN